VKDLDVTTVHEPAVDCRLVKQSSIADKTAQKQCRPADCLHPGIEWINYVFMDAPATEKQIPA
jgi:hypothetical protein